MPDKGPFSVDPKQVEGLEGASFAGVVVRLLDAERAKAGLSGVSLVQTYRTNAADGGIDAGLDSSVETAWLPSGPSSWQFKAGDLGPSACEEELAGATEALAVLRAGGKYRLILGKSLAPPLVTRRKEALKRAAEAAGINVSAGTIEVLHADHIARWAEDFPAVACSPLLRGIGTVGQTFEQWSASAAHRTDWVPSDSRTRQIEDLRQQISVGDETGVHVEGVSGLGKTRLVMEAIRGTQSESLVLYVASEDQFPPAVLHQMQEQERSVVLVIDECDAKKHDIYSAMLQTGSSIRLVSISEPSQRSTRSATIAIKPFEDTSLTELLERNNPGLWTEATRVIVEVAAGNIDYALKCAKALIAQPGATAGQLVDPADIRQFIVDELPGGALFLASCVLALFSRVGFDGDLSNELEMLAEALGIPVADLRTAGSELTARELLQVHGRYRSVGPSPVAIHLASHGWAEFGDRIVNNLLPLLNEDQLGRLFRRATEIGDVSLSHRVVEEMLGPTGPLSSLQALAAERRGDLLDDLAILSPVSVAGRISDILAAASDDELRSSERARRPLVWALQKLAWHTFTFEEAADALLRLSLVETESFSNNSTGVWLDLFGTMLPSTAASPTDRISYLRLKATTENVEVRQLVVKAAARILSVHESTMVSGELQGGVIVQPRGTPETNGDAWAYRNAAIDLLRELAEDGDDVLAASAAEGLINSIHGLLVLEPVRDHLIEALLTLPESIVLQVRAQLVELRDLHDRHDDKRGLAPIIDSMLERLPAESADDRLWLVAHASAWERHSKDLQADFTQALENTSLEEAVSKLTALLSQDLPTDFTIGKVLADFPDQREQIEITLVEHLAGPNRQALLGYLLSLEQQQSGAFDDFIERLEADVPTKLLLSTQGPRSERAIGRVLELLPEVTVADGARAVFHWLRDVDQVILAADYLEPWMARIATQEDYRAIVDLVAFTIHGVTELEPTFAEVLGRIVELRLHYPVLGQQDYDWGTLVERRLDADASRLVDLFVELVARDGVHLYTDDRQQSLFKRALRLAGKDQWFKVLDRLSDRESWRLSFSVRGWLTEAMDVAAIEEWVGSSRDKARVVASVASIGDETISPVALFLLREFGSDEDVTSPLVGEFISGMWSGNESDRIARQIKQVRTWLTQPGHSDGSRAWCRKLISYLEKRLIEARQGEAERDW